MRQPMGPGSVLGGCRSHQAPGCGKGMVTHESSRAEGPQTQAPGLGDGGPGAQSPSTLPGDSCLAPSPGVQQDSAHVGTGNHSGCRSCALTMSSCCSRCFLSSEVGVTSPGSQGNMRVK